MTTLDEEELEKEMSEYEIQMKTILPIEDKIRKLRKSGMSLGDVKKSLGDEAMIFDYVPKVLYHGSPESLDVIRSNESTQKGSHVYATDNPIHALFFSIFRNSSFARAHISEHIDENGDYKVKYIIDERVKGELDRIITDRDITIHVCDGGEFLKPQGEAYIGREWVSKDGKDIVPTKRINVNVKTFFENLEKQGLVEYSRYDKSKDWKTVLDMLGQNYPFGLGTDRGRNIEKFDALYDNVFKTYFPEQFDFSVQFRSFVKEVMTRDFKAENPGMSLDEEYNYKLKYIRETAWSFITAYNDEYGNITWNVNYDKIDEFMGKEDRKLNI